MNDIRAVYEQQFLPVRDATWLAGYVAAVEWARSADEATFRSTGFQKQLWEIECQTAFKIGSDAVLVQRQLPKR